MQKDHVFHRGSEDRVDCGGQCCCESSCAKDQGKTTPDESLMWMNYCDKLHRTHRSPLDQVMRFPSGLTVPRRPANWESCQRSTGIKGVAKSLIRDKYLMLFQDPFILAVVSEIADIGIVS